MTPEKRETAIKWLTEEVRSLRMAPKINGCGPENWADLLEIMETCLEAVRNCNEVANGLKSGTRSIMESEVMNRPFVRDITTVCECCCTDGTHDVDGNKMVPLTLEQLRKMDGKKVWIVESPNWGHWELSEDAGDYLCDRDADLYGLAYPDPDGKAGLHKLGWVAYAYPPAHIDREAWMAEWKEYIGEDAGFHYCSKCKQQAFNYEDGGEVFEVLSDFCPSCGKAMTQEAWAELEKRMGVMV